MTSLIEALAQRLPHGAVRLDTPVDGLFPLDRSHWLLTTDGGRRSLEVDAVIVATPAHHAARLLCDIDAALARELRQIEYASCAVVALGYRRQQIGHPLDGLGVVVPLIEQRAILSCSFSSVKYTQRAPEGCVLLRVFLGGACQSGVLQMPREQLIELAEHEIADLLAITGTPILRQITLQHRAMPQYHLGHGQRVARIEQRLQQYPTLALAGNALRGVGVPGCIQSGETAADQIASRLSQLHSVSPLLEQLRR
jgi:oxygen-dependent protoporphyrinogen oxidase